MNPEDDIFDLWDLFHPSDSEEGNLFPENGEWVDLEDVPQIPNIDLLPEVVDYSTRGPDDFVISGPLNGSDKIQGRRFASPKAAYIWGCQKYGKARVSIVDAGEWRWGLLIKKV